MSKIPGLIIKSISYLKTKQKSLDRTTDFKGRKFLSFFFFVFGRPIYPDIAEASDCQFAEKYLAKALKSNVCKTKKYKVNDMHFGEELIISPLNPSLLVNCSNMYKINCSKCSG